MSKYNDYNWTELYKEFLSSGLTQTNFAISKSIPKSTLQGAFKKIRSSSCSNTSSEFNSFIPVSVSKNLIASNPICDDKNITISSGKFEISVPVGFDKKMLKDILEVMVEIC